MADEGWLVGGAAPARLPVAMVVDGDGGPYCPEIAGVGVAL